MANFKVDTKLAALLGENYRSSEQALKELVDNAWDADAENVWIELPDFLTTGKIIIRDDGCGMTKNEVENEYLFVANGRISRKGERSQQKNRLVKGRKGIGKFAGLISADFMLLETKARGIVTRLEIPRKKLLEAKSDFEKFKLPLNSDECDINEHGTTITLSSLNQNLLFPNPDKLRQVLFLEYSRNKDFNIYLNGELLDIQDIPGEVFSEEIDLPDIGKTQLKFIIAEGNKPLKHYGIVLRVGGKTVGKPTFLGLEEVEDIPKKLLKRVYGEIQADGIINDVTADWGAIIENSQAYQLLQEWSNKKVREGVEKIFKRDISLAKARLQQEINRRIEKLPEHRREYAKVALEKVLQKFYGESDEKINTIVSVVLDSFERDEYWIVLKNIESTKHSDVIVFAEALNEFGLIDLANIAQQARHRLNFLDELDKLINNDKTQEKEMHVAIENNLWILGSEYSLMSSNKTLAKTIVEYTNNKFIGERANKRPDLLLAHDILDRYLLIEFKRPSHTINRDDENQAVKYRDDLTPSFGKIDILVIGKDVDEKISPHYDRFDVKMKSFKSIISAARTELEWMLKEFVK